MTEYRVMLSAMTAATAEVVISAESEDEARALAIASDDIEWQASLGEARDIEVDEVELCEDSPE